ncbi:MAG: DUF2141 domain-containing protein [Hyphomonas sp.]|jgi:uncharacterized protein (DUF2141 family)|nr:DUF2141 domain-containing protein [Hyphomonas sp.]
MTRSTPIKSALALAALLAAAGAAQAAPLTVTLNGIEARGGKLYVGVQTEAQFMKDDGIAGEIIEAPEAGSRSFTFDLPEGAYAVSIWHDFNGNGQFDTAENGMPLDGWTSPNAESLRAAPTFEQSAVSVAAGGGSTTLKMIYPK